jgi:four helix bundle protein
VTPAELRDRTAVFASEVSRFTRSLLSDLATRDTGMQLARAATATAANYRAACVARSHAEFRAKIGLSLEECDESLYWLEFLRDSGLVAESNLRALLSEAKELARILAASKRTSSRRSKRPTNMRRKRQPR